MRITFSTEQLYTRSRIDYLLSDYCHKWDLINHVIERSSDSDDVLGQIRDILHASLQKRGKPKVATKELIYSYFSDLCAFEGGRSLVKNLERMIESYEARK